VSEWGGFHERWMAIQSEKKVEIEGGAGISACTYVWIKKKKRK